MRVYKIQTNKMFMSCYKGMFIVLFFLEHKDTVLPKVWKNICMNLFRAASNTELNLCSLFLRTKLI